MQKILVCALLAAACGGGQKQTPPPPAPVANQAPAEPATQPAPAAPQGDIDVMLEQMKVFRDRFCACADSACAQHVAEDLRKWGEAMQAKFQQNVKASPEQTQIATELGEKMAECMQRAMGASTNTGSAGSASP